MPTHGKERLPLFSDATGTEPDPSRTAWQVTASRYLERLGAAEYAQQKAQWFKRGRKVSTLRYNPSQYHRDLITCLNTNNEELFKALTGIQGDSSALQHCAPKRRGILERTTRLTSQHIGQRVRIQLIPDERAPLSLYALDSATDVWRFFRDEASTWEREQFLTVLLDGQNFIIGIDLISTGTLTSTLVHLREIWKGIVLANAAGFLCVHNHLTANPAPSPEDKAMTKQIRDLAELCDVPFLDHVIVCPDSYSSMQEDAWFG